jgi:REP element-mobilizing transposase RayT
VRREYRRHLPHQIPEGLPIFLTWNLKGALPHEVIERLKREREHLLQEPPRQGESVRERSLRHGKLIFATADDFLDRSAGGPRDLFIPACAKIVEDSILFGAGQRYTLFSWCVMPNHVHLLLTPILALAKITQGLKGYTAREINRLQNQVGRTFWQDESFDHWARDEEELLRIIHYIENNPAKAGLCPHLKDWPWSSARFRKHCPVGQAFQPDFKT